MLSLTCFISEADGEIKISEERKQTSDEKPMVIYFFWLILEATSNGLNRKKVLSLSRLCLFLAKFLSRAEKERQIASIF